MVRTMGMQPYIEQLESGRWAIFNPDCTRYDGDTYKTRGAARRALNFYLKD